MCTKEPSDDAWDAFVRLHGEDFGLNYEGRSRVPIDKWSPIWLQLHKKAVDVSELLPLQPTD